MPFLNAKQELDTMGFAIIDEVFINDEVNAITDVISIYNTDQSTGQVFAIRQLLKQIPVLSTALMTTKFKALIETIGGQDYFLTKAIYFDKPVGSNWFVAYHQDLSVGVNKKAEIEGYDKWTFKHNQHAVIPPVKVLENVFTIRIHLDDTDEYNRRVKSNSKITFKRYLPTGNH